MKYSCTCEKKRETLSPRVIFTREASGSHSN